MRTATPTDRSQSGFTLLEMLVSIAIFIVVTGAIYAMLEVGRANAPIWLTMARSPRGML